MRRGWICLKEMPRECVFLGELELERTTKEESECSFKCPAIFPKSMSHTFARTPQRVRVEREQSRTVKGNPIFKTEAHTTLLICGLK